MSHLARVASELADALDRIASLETRIASIVSVGPVAERDHEKGIRLKIGGTDDEPMLSPWIKPPDHAGVSSYLPDEGQQYAALAPGGEHEGAALVPYGHSDAKPNPAADKDTTVFYSRNGVTFSEKAGVVTMKAKSVILQGEDGAKATLTKDGWKHEGGYVKDGEHRIDSTHVHGGVQRGGAKTDPPD